MNEAPPSKKKMEGNDVHIKTILDSPLSPNETCPPTSPQPLPPGCTPDEIKTLVSSPPPPIHLAGVNSLLNMKHTWNRTDPDDSRILERHVAKFINFSIKPEALMALLNAETGYSHGPVKHDAVHLNLMFVETSGGQNICSSLR